MTTGDYAESTIRPHCVTCSCFAQRLAYLDASTGWDRTVYSSTYQPPALSTGYAVSPSSARTPWASPALKPTLPPGDPGPILLEPLVEEPSFRNPIEVFGSWIALLIGERK